MTAKKAAKGGGFRRFLRLLLITVGILLFVLVAAFMALVYNPFEGSFGQVSMAVPRSIDFCLRKQQLRDWFARFPEPAAWEALCTTEAVNEFRQGPTFGELDRSLRRSSGKGVEASLEELQKTLADAPIDLFANLAARDIALAGLLSGNRLAASRWCLYARVGWKVRAGVGLLRYPFTHGWLPSHLKLTLEDELFQLTQPGGQVSWFALYRDLLLLGNDKPLVERSLALAKEQSKEDPLGNSADYEDGVLQAQTTFFGGGGEEAEQLTEEDRERIQIWTGEMMATKPLEFYFNTSRLLASQPALGSWCDPESPDFNVRLSALLVDPKSWRRLAGVLMLQGVDPMLVDAGSEETGYLSLSLTTEVNRSALATALQRAWLNQKPDPNNLLLEKVAEMTPSRACAMMAFKVPVQDFLREAFSALESAEKELLLDAISDLGKFAGIDQFLDEFAGGFLPRLGVVVRANDYRMTKDDPTTVDPRPIPAVACVFFVRSGEQDRLNRLERIFVQYAQRWGFKTPKGLPCGPGDNFLSSEFANPQIPGTGCVAMLTRKGSFRGTTMFIFANSARLIREMVGARYQSGGVTSLSRTPAWRTTRELLPTSSNGLVYLNGEELAKLMERWEEVWLRDAQGSKEDYVERNLARVEDQVRREKFASYTSRPGMPAPVQREFDKEVRARLDKAWQEQARRNRQGAAQAIKERVAWFRLIKRAYLHLHCSAGRLRLRGRASVIIR